MMTWLSTPVGDAPQIFPASKLYTPDNLRADNKASASANLRDIVLPGSALGGSWPTISALRGKVSGVLLGTGQHACACGVLNDVSPLRAGSLLRGPGLLDRAPG